ncbi:Phosphatidylinositol-4-phosphate 5-Kinase family protein [Leishmania donovani]|uniref:Phosphatidylinositol-4-phosphate 5-Kinase family protein n=1 Tax=Leishmania donovani TaxID=5661 RepID=A0A504XHN7_LEIDO|nr:Phosphatidylinositol-4-phosphate 5-Kinase family protein [Leishmania donovani]
MPSTPAAGALPVTKDVVSIVFGPVKEYSKLSAQLPLDDYDYHIAFPGFRKHIHDDSETLVALMDACTQMLPKRRRTSLSAEADPRSGALHLLETDRTTVMEAVDSLLESVDSLLDEVKGRRLDAQEQLSVTFGSELAASQNREGGVVVADAASARAGVLRLAHIRRPQLLFDTPVDNSAAPFVPYYYDASGQSHVGVAGQHPFESVIKAFSIPESQMLPRAEVPPVPLDACPLMFVDTSVAMQAMIAKLLLASEIAVDLEHHDFYSYQGFTCLMQISTREEDFIVDCLKLRSSMGALAPVFLNPSILKVLHGAREDIRWLQKDFSLYVVNFFDTGVALQTLHMPHSLAFAVDHFCQVKLNKKYQTADWRVRPLSAEMVHYARQDTHFLLYVYDRLKALLLNSEGRASIGSLLVHVYNESKQLSLQIYEKPSVVPEETYKIALGRSLSGLNKVQEKVARDVFNWRDSAAREVDDSPTAVLHLSSVLSIASKLPTTAKALLRCCAPATAVVRDNVALLVDLVKDAVASGEDDVAANEWNFYRSLCPMGVHRPMTGTLPSLASVAKTLAPTEVSQEERSALLSHTTPSPWFTAMQALSRVLAARPPQHVDLPGADVFAARQQLQQLLHRSCSVSETSQKAEEDESTADATTAAPDAEMMSESIIPLDKGAFSIKQEYGIGAKAQAKKELLASVKLEPMSDSDWVEEGHDKTNDGRSAGADGSVHPASDADESEDQNAATKNVIHCLKIALERGITSISLPEKQRPLNPQKDFSIESTMHFSASRPAKGITCCGAQATGVKKARNPQMRDARSSIIGGVYRQANRPRNDMSQILSTDNAILNSDGDMDRDYGGLATSGANFDTSDADAGDFSSDDEDDEDEENMPPVSFTFTDFSPMCYRHIREFFNVDPKAYCDVLRNSRWHSIPTPGKSAAQLFFCGRDWVIKTMTEQESDFLRKILHRYYYHVRDNPFTLLPHFVGHHRLRIGTKTQNFIIMQNVFATTNTIHEKFDLKGSTIGRFASDAEKRRTTFTQKDLDINSPMHIGPERRNLLIEQIKKDCEFLKRSMIMDYSFLCNGRTLRTNPGLGYTMGGERPDNSGADGSEFSRNGSRLDGRCFTADQGGMMSNKVPGLRQEIYYIGIIDILQEYNARKALENVVWGSLYDRKRISCVHPNDYAGRFIAFMSSIIV